MQLESIPVALWYSVSFAVVAISSSLSYSAIKSSEISIDTANAKISLSSKITATQQQLQDVLNQLDKAQSKNAIAPSASKIEQTKEALTDTVEDLNALNGDLSK
jgi:hypothetical protein